jgi:uncharacterized protein YcbK (DUF882 family)
MEIEWRWADFHPDEADGGVGMLAYNFLDRLQMLRAMYGKPMIVTSAYRSPEHNARVSSTGRDGPHTTGRAVDVLVMGGDALALVALAVECGFTGVGLSQKGNHGSRFVHLDDLPQTATRPRPWVWTY